MDPTRRTLLITTAATLLTPALAYAAANPQTPSQTEGPFYPVQIPIDADANLVNVEGMNRPATGIQATLAGQIKDLNGCSIQHAKIEIWQCDAFGAYHHPRDRGDIAEPEFQGYGFTHTGKKGEYQFRTIRPVSYPGRTPHIHVIVSKPGMAPLTTQLYVEGEPQNQRDGLFRRIPTEKQAGLLARFPQNTEESDSVIANFDIVIGYTTACA